MSTTDFHRLLSAAARRLRWRFEQARTAPCVAVTPSPESVPRRTTNLATRQTARAILQRVADQHRPASEWNSVGTAPADCSGFGDEKTPAWCDDTAAAVSFNFASLGWCLRAAAAPCELASPADAVPALLCIDLCLRAALFLSRALVSPSRRAAKVCAAKRGFSPKLSFALRRSRLFLSGPSPNAS